MKKIKGLKIAILAANGFEQSELLDPKKALEAAGATTTIVSPVKGTIKSWKDKNWGEAIPVNQTIDQAKSKDFDALLLPGGTLNPDALRIDPAAIAFIKEFVTAKKPIAAICHGPWTLINAEGVKGKKVTSWASIKIDLENAGAHWVDQEVVCDGNLVTSRKPADLPAFNKAFIELLSSRNGN